jgi:four helix bundle protein
MDYAIRAVRLHRHLNDQRDGASWIISKQYLRAATSIGANLVEAQAGESRADFIHKCSIAQKETRECKFWLTLMLRSELVASNRLQPLLSETEEIIEILTAILVKSKNGKTCEPSFQNS